MSATPCTQCGATPTVARKLCSACYQRHKYAGTLDQVSPSAPSTCERCGGPVPQGRRYGARFCSVDCKNEAMEAARHDRIVAARTARAGICAWCKEALPAERRAGSRFCSDDCGQAWQNHQKALAAERAKLATREPCEVCGNPIPLSRHAGAIYCSPKCKKRTNRSVGAKARKDQSGYNRQWRHGITPEQFADMLAAQAGRCAICGAELVGGRRTHADHCHATGKFRGVLDHDCNLGLGNFHDDPLRLAGAIVYLTHSDPAALYAAISRLEAALA